MTWVTIQALRNERHLYLIGCRRGRREPGHALQIDTGTRKNDDDYSRTTQHSTEIRLGVKHTGKLENQLAQGGPYRLILGPERTMKTVADQQSRGLKSRCGLCRERENVLES